MNNILKKALEKEIQEKQLEINLLQKMLGNQNPQNSHPLLIPIIVKRKYKTSGGLKDKVLQCIQCEPKPVTPLYIGNKLGGHEIAKDDKLGRRRHFGAVSCALSTLNNEQLVKRRLNGGVYEYSKI